jgi:transcriptional regulator with XRE-family HTH domain
VRHIPESGSDTWAASVRRNRERLQLTQLELADKLGVTRETVGRWESGKLKPGNIDTALAAIRVLGMDRDTGLRLAGYAPSDTQPAEDPYAYVREMGLDPNNRVVRRILNLKVDEDFRMRLLRRERELQVRDEQARLDALEWTIDQQDGHRRAG